jgi:signal transduction histidine kinase
MFCTDISEPFLLVFSKTVPQLLYYSHIPTAIIALMLGLFVYFKNKNGGSLVSKLLLFISLTFFVWSVFDLILWTNIDSRRVMSVWSIINLMEMFVSVSTLYFAYVFLEKRDTPFKYKLIAGVPLLAYMSFIPTRINVPGFDIPNCEAEQGKLIYYFYFLEIFFFFWLLTYLIKKIITTSRGERKMTIYFSIGAVCFLASFSGANVVASLTEKWQILQYGLFGMPVFMAFLAFIIIKYKAFNIKLLGAQALVMGIIILIASQFAFIQNSTNRILTAVTLAIVAMFGWWLTVSVKRENEQNESLKQLNSIIAKQKDRIEKDKETVERANQELIRLDKAKTEFINIASHQLRTPISVISGVASMMLEGDMEKMPMEQKQKFYQSVWEKAKKLKVIVHDILNATSFANKKYSIMDQSAEMIDVPEFIGKIIKDFKMEVEERDIDLTFSSEKNIPKIKGQKEYLEEAFINLINNSIKYTPSSKMNHEVRGKKEGNGRGKVAVSIKKDLNNPKNIIVEVKDNGIGIPEEAKPKLFQRFSRAQNAVNMYTDGTGLGLFIVKEIAEGHGGKVWFESELDKGTTFFISLPVNPEVDVDIKDHITQDAKSNPEVKF